MCVKHSVRHMVDAGGGSFIAMSSIAGHQTHPYFGAYTVSKSGIEEMMRNCANEFGARGVRFNAIRPGFIATEIMEVPTPTNPLGVRGGRPKKPASLKLMVMPLRVVRTLIWSARFLWAM